MNKAKKLTEREQTEWNASMYPVLALGRVSSAWAIIEDIWRSEDEQGCKMMCKVFDALNEYDEMLRERLRKQGW